MKIALRPLSPKRMQGYLSLVHLTDLLANEMGAVHVVEINLDAILAHEKLGKHELFTAHTEWRSCGRSARFHEHAFFKALSLVLTSGITAVLH